MEYKEQHPDGYQYTQFCEHYRRWSRRRDVVMRQPHVAGENLFVDFAGETVPVIDAKTGTVSQAEVFVAVLGASNYTYAEVCPSQELKHGYRRSSAGRAGRPQGWQVGARHQLLASGP